MLAKSKVVAFLGSNPNPKVVHASVDREFLLSGKNSGNYAFWTAVDRHISNEKIYLDSWNFDPVSVKNNADIFVVPASNFIHKDRDLGALALNIEKTGLPIVVIGLGAQNSDRSDLVLKDGTKYFLDLLNRKSVFLSVRGEYTASVLEKHGVQDFEILGCPSNLLNGDPRLGDKVAKKYQAVKEKSEISIVFNFDLHRKFLEPMLSELLSKLGENYFEFICQNPIGLVRLGRREIDFRDVHVDRHIDFLRRTLPHIDPVNFLKERYRSFFNAYSWMEYISCFDFSIGTRFHGNMLAFQSAVPTLFLGHDARTSELVKRHHLPSAPVADACSSISGLLQSEFDGNKYDYWRIQDEKIYRQKLSQCGILVNSIFH